MALNSAANFVRQDVGSSVGTSDPETIDVADASEFPDPSVYQFDIVIWDAGTHTRPDQDSDVEIMTVTGRDTGNNTLTCARGQQGTSNTSHPSSSDVILSPLAEMDVKKASMEQAVFPDSTADPSANGEMQRNGTDLKAFSGGSVRNLSNIGSGGGSFSTTAADSNTTTSGEGIYLIDTSGGARTLTLASSDATSENAIGAVNISGSNDLTVDTESTETIDPGGASSKTLSTGGYLVWFNGDGTNWDSDLDVDVESLTTSQLTVDGFTGTPVWAEESGSPYTASSSGSINPSNLDNFDVYLVRIEGIDQASDSTNADMTVGGDTGTNYGWFGQDASLTTGQSQFTRILTFSVDGEATTILHLYPTGGNVAFRNLAGGFAGSVPVMGRNSNVTFPMSQFTLSRGVSTDWTVRIWGFNF